MNIRNLLLRVNGQVTSQERRKTYFNEDPFHHNKSQSSNSNITFDSPNPAEYNTDGPKKKKNMNGSLRVPRNGARSGFGKRRPASPKWRDIFGKRPREAGHVDFQFHTTMAGGCLAAMRSVRFTWTKALDCHHYRVDLFHFKLLELPPV